jgi:hypothetical protein
MQRPMPTRLLLIAAAALSFVVLSVRPASAQAPGAEEMQPLPRRFDVDVPPPQLAVAQLSASDDALLRRGEIGVGRYVTGGVIGSYYGFGVGHAIQGRWSDKGWIFTVGDAGSLGLLVYGITRCEEAEQESIEYDRVTSCSLAPIVAGLVGFGAFRIWEIVDVWAGVPRHNRRVRRLRQRLEGVRFYAAPTGSSSAAAGMTLRF